MTAVPPILQAESVETGQTESDNGAHTKNTREKDVHQHVGHAQQVIGHLVLPV